MRRFVIDLVGAVLVLLLAIIGASNNGWHWWPRTVGEALTAYGVAFVLMLWAFVRAWNNGRKP